MAIEVTTKIINRLKNPEFSNMTKIIVFIKNPIKGGIPAITSKVKNWINFSFKLSIK